MKNGKLVFLCLLLLLLTPSLAFGNTEVDQLQQEIQAKQKKIDLLKQEEARYQESLKIKRQESITLSNQIDILSDQISGTKIKIELTETTIESTNLKISNLQATIKKHEQNINDRKQELGALVRWLSRSQDRSLIQVLFTKESFSDFYSELQRLQTIQQSIGKAVDDIEAAKTALSEEQKQLEENRASLIAEVNNLSDRKFSLEDQQNVKDYLLKRTRSSEAQFKALLEEARRAQESANNEIVNLERVVREKLRNEGVNVNGPAPVLMWPVPKNTITTSFKDPDYPFRRLFEHMAIDIRASQGTVIRAPAAGYVARVSLGSPKKYWFVMIIHEGGLATVYGHVSKVFVPQDGYVTQGQAIGQTGGLPGTPGAGPFSTGPHLHFEVRKDGVPVNPLSHLP